MTGKEIYDMAAPAPAPSPNFASPAKVHQMIQSDDTTGEAGGNGDDEEQPFVGAQDPASIKDVCRNIMMDSRNPALWKAMPGNKGGEYLPWQTVINLLHKHAGGWECKTTRVSYSGEGTEEEVTVTVRLTIYGFSRDGSKSEKCRGVSRQPGQEFDRPAVETAERRALVRAATYFGLSDKPKR